ncbi:hypothetical protein QQF64_017911 [Cirrhinus molitorella]|uniref:Uncharacterized protein n=1 Tax=Cirrhinus molitorella TaxID=172907 RepID=A0ABR3LP26_9TELE
MSPLLSHSLTAEAPPSPAACTSYHIINRYHYCQRANNIPFKNRILQTAEALMEGLLRGVWEGHYVSLCLLLALF